MIQPLSLSRAKLIRALHRKKERVAERAYLAEGERLLDELARSGVEPWFLFGAGERLAWLEEQFPEAAIYRLDGEGAGLFATENAQGVGAIVPMPEPAPLDEVAAADRPLLLLDALADPGNVGTIIRTAEWFGMGAVLLGEGTVDAFNPKTVRATMGAIFRLDLVENVTADAVARLGLPVLALDTGGEKILGETELPRRAIWVVGSEAHGVSRALLDIAEPIAIRGAGEGESLNAAVAAGVLCYELMKGGRVEF